MATYVPSMLAFGQLPNVKGDLYTPSGVTKGMIDSILVCNQNTTAEQVELLLHDGANEYHLYDVSVGADETAVFPGFVLENGDKITGNTTTASKVTYMISGSERTA